MVILYLTCADSEEAKKIALAILDAKLAACVRRQPVESDYWWDGRLQHSSEVMLMIESKAEKFDAINTLIKKLHSYKNYVLTAVPVTQTNLISWPGSTRPRNESRVLPRFYQRQRHWFL